ncbi:hypothetical protein [Streptomyces sp. TP-A0356]|uniref:hypothetical protein n=1 Tax=Streptomyces sp. TP-A0356 TaxID=1359208 RepID=UPI000A58FB74|nr:hypothetical protein [Streptomyces sp. TP-A0356]
MSLGLLPPASIDVPGGRGGDGTHRETTIDRLRFAADGITEPVVPTLEPIGPVRDGRPC